MTKDYVVGIDIGGQSVKMGVIDRRANFVARKSFSMAGYGADDTVRFLDDVCKYIVELTANVGLDSIQGVGIGAPDGNYYDGTIVDAVNLPWAKGKIVPLRDHISGKLGLNVTVTNDANAAAIGEMTYGNAIGMKNFIEITLGTGVGSGIVVDGKLVYGHDGFAGELGHTTAVRYNGRKCGCGKTGCLETYASSGGVCQTAREMLEASNEPSVLRQLETITSKCVFEAAVAGDKIAINVFEYTGRILGEKFADFIAFSAPEAIIIFGGVSNAGDLLLNPTKKAMEENVVGLWKGKVKVLRSGLPESDAAILGAGALAW
ncbi:MAG: ROK family protein [Bacteroidales bacterium]|nr:ROK family protein [Candidatus Cacconaster merdequi]